MAVILDAGKPIAGLKDSKLLSASRREMLFVLIQANSTAFAIAQASDDRNVSNPVRNHVLP